MAVQLDHIRLDIAQKCFLMQIEDSYKLSAMAPAQRCCSMPEAWLTFLCPHAALLQSVCLKLGSVSHAVRGSGMLTLVALWSLQGEAELVCPTAVLCLSCHS